MANEWLRYANQNATRNQPLDPRLVNALSFLPALGVQAEVFSGGQDAEGPRRTGSRRHDHGGAGDMRFYRDGRMLDWAKPEDQPIFQDIVRKAKENGVTGIGAGPGYMGQGTMHLGFGTPGVWGAGGRSANAPEWLRAAYGELPASKPMASYDQAMATAAPTKKPDIIAEVMAAADPKPPSAPLFGAAPMAATSPSIHPTPGPPPTSTSPPAVVGNQPPVPQAVQNLISGNSGNKAANVFGALAMMGNQGPQFSPVQIRGPSQEQAQGLSQLVQALRKRLA